MYTILYWRWMFRMDFTGCAWKEGSSWLKVRFMYAYSCVCMCKCLYMTPDDVHILIYACNFRHIGKVLYVCSTPLLTFKYCLCAIRRYSLTCCMCVKRRDSLITHYVCVHITIFEFFNGQDMMSICRTHTYICILKHILTPRIIRALGFLIDQLILIFLLWQGNSRCYRASGSGGTGR